MPDIFDDLNNILKKDLVPIVIKYLKDPNNKFSENINNFLSEPRIFVTDIFEKYAKSKDNDDNQNSYIDIDVSFDDEYDDLLKRLSVIEKNMIQIKNILKDEN